MADVKDQIVLRSVEHIMQTYNQFYGSETGGQVSRILRAALDDVVSDLAAKRLQFLYAEFPEVFRRIDLIKNHRGEGTTLFRHFSYIRKLFEYFYIHTEYILKK